MEITAEIKKDKLVQFTIDCIKIMWDCRSDKSIYEKQNWLNGICSQADETLSMLYGVFAKNNESVKQFAIRLAEIK